MNLFKSPAKIAKKAPKKRAPPKRAVQKKRVRRAATVTYAPAGENGKGMEIIGDKDAPGLDVEDLKRIFAEEQQKGTAPEWFDLNQICGVPVDHRTEPACIIRFRGGGDDIAGEEGVCDRLEAWLASESCLKQTRKFMWGRMTNSQARFNTLFYEGPATQPTDAEIEAGKSTKMPFDSNNDVWQMWKAMGRVVERDLAVAEVNHYVDVDNKASGIGYHGDKERNMVIMLRLGEGSELMPLRFQAFVDGGTIGKNAVVHLKHGDVLIMPRSVCCPFWLDKNVTTWRHAAGNKAAWSNDMLKKFGPQPEEVHL